MLLLSKYPKFAEYLEKLFHEIKVKTENNQSFKPYIPMRILEILINPCGTKRKKLKDLTDYEFVNKNLSQDAIDDFFKLIVQSLEIRVLVFFEVYEQFFKKNNEHILDFKDDSIQFLLRNGYSLAYACAITYIVGNEAKEVVEYLENEISGFSEDYDLKRADLIISLQTLFRGIVSKGFTNLGEISKALDVFEIDMPKDEKKDVIRALRIFNASIIALNDYHYKP